MRRWMIAGAPHYVNDIALHARFDAHGANFRTATRDGIGFAQRLDVDLIEPARIEACVPTRDDLMLFVSGGVGQQNLEEKTIELSLRQRICSFVLNWILSRQHSEHRRQWIQFTVNCYLPFFHRFEQCGLRFGWRAIDLVTQQDVSEDRSPSQTKT